MIEYTYLTDFSLEMESKYTDWLKTCITDVRGGVIELSYVFADDDLVLDLNKRFLNHDWKTDILTFGDQSDEGIKGEIVISVERVTENASVYNTTFDEELKRVMAHGVLHLLGFDDNREEDKKNMRAAEEKWIKKFHVEQ